MTKRIRAKCIRFEVTDEMWHDIHQTAKELNITMRAYIWRLIVPDLLKRKELREEEKCIVVTDVKKGLIIHK